MVLIIDNYDSFTYNLAQYLGELGWEPVVYRNDKLSLEDIERLGPSHIIISPGPCTPLEAGISNDVIWRFSGRIPILGVCLGHQCIGYVFYHDGKSVYRNLSNPFEAGRYHSLVVNKETLSSSLTLAAWTGDGVVMGIRHKDYVVEGVQFHPESIMTEVGHDVLSNFLAFSQPRWALP